MDYNTGDKDGRLNAGRLAEIAFAQMLTDARILHEHNSDMSDRFGADARLLWAGDGQLYVDVKARCGARLPVSMFAVNKIFSVASGGDRLFFVVAPYDPRDPGWTFVELTPSNIDEVTLDPGTDGVVHDFNDRAWLPGVGAGRTPYRWLNLEKLRPIHELFELIRRGNTDEC